MTVKECYEVLGADYEEVMNRLRKEERVQRFLKKLLDDKTYALLNTSLQTGNMEEAFRAAHTLKGVSQNLSLKNLYVPASCLSDCLKERRECTEEVETLFEKVKEEYIRTTEAIKQL